jgi:hypothetical protein
MQFVPTPEQAEAIKAEAAATGRPIASVLREAVEQWRLARTTQHAIEESDLDELVEDEELPMPREWLTTGNGKPMPNVVRAIRLSRAGR